MGIGEPDEEMERDEVEGPWGEEVSMLSRETVS